MTLKQAKFCDALVRLREKIDQLHKDFDRAFPERAAISPVFSKLFDGMQAQTAVLIDALSQEIEIEFNSDDFIDSHTNGHSGEVPTIEDGTIPDNEPTL